MVLSVDDNCMFDHFEYTNCTIDASPPGWLNFVVSPDCAEYRQAIMYPTDADNEVLIINEATKKNISYLGLTTGTTITVKLTVGASNFNWGTNIINGTHTFEVRIYSIDPGYYNWDAPTHNFCIYGGQVVLSGANTTTTGITFMATTTLIQDANWIGIGTCPDASGFNGSGGIVFDDLEICW